MIIPRHFNTIESTSMNTIIKKGNIDGERFWYLNIPDTISQLFPKLIRYDDNEIEIEEIEGTPLSLKFIRGEMTTDDIMSIFNYLFEIHTSHIEVFEADTERSLVLNSFFTPVNIYANYADKLKFRFCNYNYTFKHSTMFANTLYSLLQKYEKEQKGDKAVIHGDPVFTNILIDKDDTYKFIDMRGKLGDTYSIYGDINYDYAKIYQSLCRYDFILHGVTVDKKYINELKECFEDYIVSLYGRNTLYYIKVITASLLFTLIPLHNNSKCEQYYELARSVLC